VIKHVPSEYIEENLLVNRLQTNKRRIFRMSSYPVWDDFWKGKLENLVIGKEIPDGEKEASQVSIPTESEFFCRTCSVQLLTREEQVTHYKSPEHRSLLKSKLRAKTGDAENESGSESDTSEEVRFSCFHQF